jgi:N-acetylglucosamine-6-phosphate deacetylase
MPVRTVRGRDPATEQVIEIAICDGLVESITTAGGPCDTWLAPGLVDLQVNGFAGCDVNEAGVEVETIVALVDRLAAVGVTCFVPTIISAAEGRITAALSAVAAARKALPRVERAIPYVHVEGPFISAEPGARGAHDPVCIRPPDLAELHRWQRGCDGLVGLVTVSPHSDEAIGFIAEATQLGVRCAIGHTQASPAQVVRAADAGARLSTHLGNGVHAVLPRHPNYLWAQLAEDRLAAGFIADGHHLSHDTFRAMLRAKGLHRSHLVSDATALAGMPPGRYRTPVGGTVDVSASGRVSLAGTDLLAGAARSLADGVATAIAMAELTLADAVALATAHPGRFVGGRGVLRPDTPADLILFRWEPGDPTLQLERVLAGGDEVCLGRPRPSV